MRQNLILYIRKTSMILLFAIVFSSCNNAGEKKEEIEISETDPKTETIYHGEFIYTPEAAVFSGKSFVYGVEMNKVAKDLATRVEAVQKDDYDIVPVAVQGRVSKKLEGAEGWDEIITITHIISVSDTPIKADVQL